METEVIFLLTMLISTDVASTDLEISTVEPTYTQAGLM